MLVFFLKNLASYPHIYNTAFLICFVLFLRINQNFVNKYEVKEDLFFPFSQHLFVDQLIACWKHFSYTESKCLLPRDPSFVKTVTCGVPQTSTLGHLMFLCYSNDLQSVFLKSVTHHIHLTLLGKKTCNN